MTVQRTGTDMAKLNRIQTHTVPEAVLDRRQAVPALIERPEEYLVVAGLAGAAQELTAMTRDGPNVFGLGGAMGAAPMMALGLALAQPRRRVLCVTGDGELLMNVGALATIALLKTRLVANAAEVGAYLIDGLRSLAGKHPLVGDVRGRGLMIGVELVRDRQTKERATSERDAVVTAAFNRGLLVLGAGKNAVRFSPPLVLTREQADTAVRIFDEALTEVGGRVAA